MRLRAALLLGLLLVPSAHANQMIDLPDVLASAMTPNGSNGQCWETIDTNGDQGWGSCSGGSGGVTGATGGTGSNGSTGATGASGATGATGAIGSIGTFNTASTANGLDVNTGTGVLTLHAADGTNPGALTAVAQTIAGAKTFTSPIVAPSGASPAVGLQIGSAANGLYAGANGTSINLGFAGITGPTGITELGATYMNLGAYFGGAAGGGYSNPGSSINFYNSASAVKQWVSLGYLNFSGGSEFNMFSTNGTGVFFSENFASSGSMAWNSSMVNQGVGYYSYEMIANSNYTTYAPTYITSPHSSAYSDPVLTMRNTYGGVDGNHEGIGFAGSTINTQGSLIVVNEKNSLGAGNEQSRMEVQLASAGVLANKFTLDHLGSPLFTGSTLTMANIGSVTPGTNGAACFSSAGVLGTDSTNCIVSLREYKQDFTSIPSLDALATMLKLGAKAVTYRLRDSFLGRWKNKPHSRDRQPGFIADEVEAIDKSLVTYRGKKLAGVRYEQMIAVQAAAMVEMEKQILALQNAHWYDWFVQKWRWLGSKVR